METNPNISIIKKKSVDQTYQFKNKKQTLIHWTKIQRSRYMLFTVDTLKTKQKSIVPGKQKPGVALSLTKIELDKHNQRSEVAK